MKVGLTYNLRKDYQSLSGEPEDLYAEFDSEETIEALKTTIQELGHEVVLIGDARGLIPFLSPSEIDLVFNIAEGMEGRSREAQIPAMLETFRIPYVFSDPLTLALCLDKGMTKRVMKTEGIPTPEFLVVEETSDLNGSLPFPLFIKPAYEGTAKGIDVSSRVRDFESLLKGVSRLLSIYRQPVLVERYLPGDEFTVGIIGTGKKARILGMMKVVVKDESQEDIYTQIAKEECETRVLYLPCDTTPDHLRERIETISLKAYRVLGCRDAGRVDIRCDELGNPHFLEINPLAGLHPTHSDLCIIASQAGITYRELIGAIIDSALDRYPMKGR